MIYSNELISFYINLYQFIYHIYILEHKLKVSVDFYYLYN